MGNSKYEIFLKMAKTIYGLAKEDKLFDIENKKLKRANLSKGLYLGMKLDNGQYIGVKIGIGSKEELKEVFKKL